MPPAIGTSPADQWKAEVEAERTLARMDLIEDLAVLAEEEPCPHTRKRLAERYRSFVGVAPEERRQLRARLQQVLSQSVE